jgi:hypothetical protein
MKARTLLIGALLSILSVPAFAGPFYGMLRARDLTPFGFLRLDMRPAHAVSIEPGSWVLETEFDYQNTWALSPEVEKYLNGLEGSGRRHLGPQELADIRALPGENYLVDLEMATVDVTLHYKFSPHVAGYVIMSGVSYEGGFMDDTIERFHDSAGFHTFGRPAVARNDVNLIYDLKGTRYASLGTAPSHGGLLDPTIGLRYGTAFGDRWRMSVEGAAKIAVAGKRTLLSTGRSDAGAQVAVQYRGNRQAFYANVAAVYYAGGDFPVRARAQVVPTLILGYEYVLTPNTNINLQAYASPSVYTHRETDLQELLVNKYQVTAGFRHRMNDMIVTFGITENVQNINNTPDIGFQLGVAWVPAMQR